MLNLKKKPRLHILKCKYCRNAKISEPHALREVVVCGCGVTTEWDLTGREPKSLSYTWAQYP